VIRYQGARRGEKKRVGRKILRAKMSDYGWKEGQLNAEGAEKRKAKAFATEVTEFTEKRRSIKV